MFQFPLAFRFRNFTLGEQIVVTDAADREVCYIKQKAFRLRESVTVFRDQSEQQIVGKIESDRILDWSARYIFFDAEGRPFGAVGRRGARSLWRTHYDIFSNPQSREASMSIEEESVLTRMLDGLVEQIPVIGMFSGYLFHPAYAIRSREGTTVARLRKRAALLEGRFTLEKLTELSDEQELEILLSVLMMALLERHRG
jgi:uncharacterized protein YxjI